MKERGLECYHRGLTARPGANIFAVREKNRPIRVHRFLMTRLTNANLTRREAQIMEILHRHRRATVEESARSFLTRRARRASGNCSIS
jgi:hypothetical protein